MRGGEAGGCVFCDALTEPDAEPLILFRGPTCYVILNLYPYNNGHLLVVPNRHIASLAAATRDELCELIELTRRAELALTEGYAPQGLNMGINLGKTAGAGVLNHLHHARRAAVERRHELHDGRRGDAGVAGGVAGDREEAQADLREAGAETVASESIAGGEFRNACRSAGRTISAVTTARFMNTTPTVPRDRP